MKMAPDSMEKINHEDLRRAAEQLKYTQPDEMVEIGAKMANATLDELASMRSQADAQINYHLNAAQMLKQKVLATEAKNVKALYRRGQAYKSLWKLKVTAQVAFYQKPLRMVFLFLDANESEPILCLNIVYRYPYLGGAATLDCGCSHGRCLTFFQNSSVADVAKMPTTIPFMCFVGFLSDGLPPMRSGTPYGGIQNQRVERPDGALLHTYSIPKMMNNVTSIRTIASLEEYKMLEQVTFLKSGPTLICKAGLFGNGVYQEREWLISLIIQGEFQGYGVKTSINWSPVDSTDHATKAPRSPEYVPDPMELEDHVPVYIPELEHPEDLVPAEDEAPIETYIIEVVSAPTPPLPPPSFSPSLIRPPRTRAAMAQMRAAAPSTYHSLLPSGTPPLLPIPLPAPSTSRRSDILEADTPPRKRLLLTAPRPRCEVGESSVAVAVAARQS
ncbi:putative reverse transcriptase domain-containing protein [Tanacetum coccineum]